MNNNNNINNLKELSLDQVSINASTEAVLFQQQKKQQKYNNNSKTNEKAVVTDLVEASRKRK